MIARSHLYSPESRLPTCSSQNSRLSPFHELALITNDVIMTFSFCISDRNSFYNYVCGTIIDVHMISGRNAQADSTHVPRVHIGSGVIIWNYLGHQAIVV